MSASATLSQDAASTGSPVDDHFPWDIEAAPSVVENDTWLLSFIDILTLLLALFVLLLAQEFHRNKEIARDIPVEPARVVVEPVLPTPEPEPMQSLALLPFSTIQLPALPQIVAPLDKLQLPVPERKHVSVEAIESELAAAETEAEDTMLPEPPVAADTNATRLAQSPVNSVAQTPVDDLIETLRASGLDDRIDIQARTDSVQLDIADSILFAPARTRLTDDGLELLRELSTTLQVLPWSLSVEGHTDNVPIQTSRFPSNWELSTARATVVARALIEHGIRPERIRAIGYADTQPRDSNTTVEGRNRNRRVTFVLEVPASTDSGTEIPSEPR